MLLICSDYRSKYNLLIVVKFGCLYATYSLSVQYLCSKHDSLYVMGLDIYVHSLVYNPAQLCLTKNPVRRTLWISHAATWASS